MWYKKGVEGEVIDSEIEQLCFFLGNLSKLNRFPWNITKNTLEIWKISNRTIKKLSDSREYWPISFYLHIYDIVKTFNQSEELSTEKKSEFDCTGFSIAVLPENHWLIDLSYTTIITLEN